MAFFSDAVFININFIVTLLLLGLIIALFVMGQRGQPPSTEVLQGLTIPALVVVIMLTVNKWNEWSSYVSQQGPVVGTAAAPTPAASYQLVAGPLAESVSQ